MKILLNRSQLARRLNIAAETLRNKIDSGEIKPDAQDDQGRDLFNLEKYSKPQAKKS